MSTTYTLGIESLTNIDENITLMTDRINADPFYAPYTLTSITYDDTLTLYVTFTTALDPNAESFLDVLLWSIFWSLYTGSDVNYENNTLQYTIRNMVDYNIVPTAITDAYAGYAIGSVIYNNTNNISYTCVDATPNQAVWVRSTTNILTGPTGAPNPVSFYNNSFSIFAMSNSINVGTTGYLPIGGTASGTLGPFDVGTYGYNFGAFSTLGGTFTAGSSGYYTTDITIGFGDTGNTSINILSLQLYDLNGATAINTETHPVVDGFNRFYKMHTDCFLNAGNYQFQLSYSNPNPNAFLVGGNITVKDLFDSQPILG